MIAIIVLCLLAFGYWSLSRYWRCCEDADHENYLKEDDEWRKRHGYKSWFDPSKPLPPLPVYRRGALDRIIDWICDKIDPPLPPLPPKESFPTRPQWKPVTPPDYRAFTNDLPERSHHEQPPGL